MVKASQYEKDIVEIMRENGMTLTEALNFDFMKNKINVTDVLSVCDYLEEKLVDLDKVQYYMLIFTGQKPDLELKQ
jgi:hypothetical protein